METLWADLCKAEDDLPVYQWQKDILDNREGLVDRGDAEFEDWDIAKKKIAEQISSSHTTAFCPADFLSRFSIKSWMKPPNLCRPGLSPRTCANSREIKMRLAQLCRSIHYNFSGVAPYSIDDYCQIDHPCALQLRDEHHLHLIKACSPSRRSGKLAW